MLSVTIMTCENAEVSRLRGTALLQMRMSPDENSLYSPEKSDEGRGHMTIFVLPTYRAVAEKSSSVKA